MFIGVGNTVPEIANLPGVSRPGRPGVGGGLQPIANNFSMQFNGIDEYFDAGDVVELNSVTNYSITFWLNPRSLPVSSTQIILSKFFANGDRIEITLSSGATLNSLTFVNSSSNSLSFTQQALPTPAPTSGWYHVAMVYDGTFTDANPLTQNRGRLKHYINANYVPGSFAGTQNAQSSSLSGRILSLGKRQTSPSPALFNGYIDEVAVYDYSLSSTDVQAIFDITDNDPTQTADLSTLTTPPIAWYRMGD